MIEESELREIEKNARERFDERVEEEGDTAPALGWDSKSSMQTRFEAAAEMYDFADKRVIDVGCGFGDFYEFLVNRGEQPREYYGLDVSENALDIAREKQNAENCTFERRNVLVDPFEDEQFDIAVEFGVLNYNFDGVNNERYARLFLDRCYSFSDGVLINCLSSYREGDWEYEEFIHYFDPEKLFGFAQELSRDVVLHHDFPPIPQKEFNLLVR
jgi:SAM-dependent methyltransferase